MPTSFVSGLRFATTQPEVEGILVLPRQRHVVPLEALRSILIETLRIAQGATWMDGADTDRTETEADVTPSGCCCGDPYANLPAEVRPKLAEKTSELRQVTCPLCGLIYLTNRKTDVCVRCE